MPTECSADRFEFAPVEGRRVVAGFYGGTITSDAGANYTFEYDETTKKWTGLSGVNVTVGLPFLRVSVDHGTAFDRAWKGIANHESMVEALEVATRMLRRT